MSRKLSFYLSDILKSISNIQSYTANITYDELIQDQKTLDAITYNLLIIGEATKQVPNNLRSKYSQIEWKQIAGIRDIIAHAYFSINTRIVWNIIENELITLKDCIELIQQNEDLE